METSDPSHRKRLIIGIIFGIILFLIYAGIYSSAVFMVSILVFGCLKIPPDWLYMIVFIGFPIPLVISAVVTPYLYIKKQRLVWIVLSIAAGLFLSGVIFLTWFLILTQYC